MAKVVSSYSVELLRANHIFDATVAIYRSALEFCVKAAEYEWATISTIAKPLLQVRVLESMLHTTMRNTAMYPEFDKLFPKLPSYLRRAAIQAAIGIVSSYHSNLAAWERSDKKTKPPVLRTSHQKLPCFYHQNMYKETDSGYVVELKLFVHNDWVWVPFRLRKTDVDYLDKHFSGINQSSPVLEKHYGKYFLRYAIEENKPLSMTLVKNQVICAVDLGINTDAVCSIMDANGAILGRKFIDFPSDKDHVVHVLNRVKRFQRENNAKDVVSFWNYAKRLNAEHARKIAQAIVEYAAANKADVIVFEYLSMGGKIRGSKKQRLALWRKNDIQTIATLHAHRFGMRISRICAWGTSALAFDGSGKLTRDEHNHALATFANGKQYNCDLSASYNIGARYFIRELLKPLSATARSQAEAKVPSLARRTSCTLATLRAFAALAA